MEFYMDTVYMELETEESVVPLEYYFFANFQYISFSDFN